MSRFEEVVDSVLSTVFGAALSAFEWMLAILACVSVVVLRAVAGFTCFVALVIKMVLYAILYVITVGIVAPMREGISYVRDYDPLSQL